MKFAKKPNELKHGQLPQQAPDYHVIRTYLEYVLNCHGEKLVRKNLTSMKHARYSTRPLRP